MPESEIRKRVLESMKTSTGVTTGPPILQGLSGTLLETLLALPLSLLCGLIITQVCIKTMYNVPRGTTNTTSNQLGIFEDLGDVYSQTDLDLFFGLLAQYVLIDYQKAEMC